jgi:hypothetical protein
LAELAERVMLQDVLRNEKPVYIYFTQNRGFLSTSREPIGKAE